jgi:hypothetical protein
VSDPRSYIGEILEALFLRVRNAERNFHRKPALEKLPPIFIEQSH